MKRASQINGCAFCIHHHTTDSHKYGETGDRPHFLACGAALYSNRDRAALDWTEALTLVSETHAPDDAYEALRRHFSGDDHVKRALLIAQVNAGTRINIGFRAVHPADEMNGAA